MRIRLRHIISALLLLAALGSAAQDAEREARKQAELLTHDPENTEALTSLMFHHLHKADYRKAIDYGERLLEKQEAEALYRSFGKAVRTLPAGWRILVLSSHTEFERAFGRSAEKKRKLYNGMLKCDAFFYHGGAKQE